MHLLIQLACVGFLSVLSVSGHGMPDTPAMAEFRVSHLKHSKRSLDQCKQNLLTSAALHKRFSKRDSFLEDHLSTEHPDPRSLIYPRDELLSVSSSCLTTPESEEGPFYVTGSLVRKDIREHEPGIPLLLDVQVIDVRTCEPISDVMLDFWSCNATGAYSGFEHEGTADLTYLRGLQPSDENGIAQVITAVPGWYPGRAQHIHIKAHVNYTQHSNDTITFGSVVHTGQLYFTQEMLTEVNALYPYTLDVHGFTPNAKDHDLQRVNGSGWNPFLSIRPLGHELSSGLLGFINIAINPEVVPPGVGRPPHGEPGHGHGPPGRGHGPPPDKGRHGLGAEWQKVLPEWLQAVWKWVG